MKSASQILIVVLLVKQFKYSNIVAVFYSYGEVHKTENKRNNLHGYVDCQYRRMYTRTENTSSTGLFCTRTQVMKLK
jgi:hypothetical protein